MRGPGLRVLCDVRRTWECPVCGYQRHVGQTETSVRCQCTKDQPFMKLVEGLRKVRAERTPLDAYMEFDLEEVEAAAPEDSGTETTDSVAATGSLPAPAPEQSLTEIPEEAAESLSAGALPEADGVDDNSDDDTAAATAGEDDAQSDGEPSKPKRRKRGRRRRKKGSGGNADAGTPPPTA